MNNPDKLALSIILALALFSGIAIVVAVFALLVRIVGMIGFVIPCAIFILTAVLYLCNVPEKIVDSMGGRK